MFSHLCFDSSTCKEETKRIPVKENNRNRGEEAAPDQQKVTQLRAIERLAVVKAMDKDDLLSFVYKSVPQGLVPGFFPERINLWKHLQATEELKQFTYMVADKYIAFFESHSKGKEKYANLYLSWLGYISSFTCRSQQSLANLCTLALLLGE